MKINLSEELKELDNIIESNSYHQRTNLYSKWKKKLFAKCEDGEKHE